MSNAQYIINEIQTFLNKSLLKNSQITKGELINFIEQKWKEADDEKYSIHYGGIIIGRMTNEYIWTKDFDNMMKWFNEMDIHSISKKNPDYINNYYKGQCCLECGNEEKALEYFNLSYFENQDYVFSKSPYFSEFFNKNVESSRNFLNQEGENEENIDFTIKLKYWQSFFNEELDIYYNILGHDGEYISVPTKEQKNGIIYLQQNQEKILENILTELGKEYPDLQKKYKKNNEINSNIFVDIVMRNIWSGGYGTAKQYAN